MNQSLSIPDGSKLYLDANAIIYAVEGAEPFASLVRPIFARIDDGNIGGFTSDLTLAEVLVMPMRKELHAIAETYGSMICESAIHVVPVSREVLIQVSALRAKLPSLKLPDAIHAASALHSTCNVFVTNDTRFRAVESLRVVLLSDLVPSS